VGDELSAYRKALDYLFARTTGKTKFGLQRTEALLSALGDPHQKLRHLHVAGTNGKGSVCATLDTLLRSRGLRVGRYTSPHLVDFRERFLIDGRPVGEAAIVEFIDRWTPDVERLGATFFEATTAMAFDLFAAAEVDIAVIETGLGGRLDATNVIEPLVAGVTSIGIDHVEYLGSTREEIAAEKAGIYKPGVPAIVGDIDPHVRQLLSDLARERGATPIRVAFDECLPRDVDVSVAGTRATLSLRGETATIRTPLAGSHQAVNLAVALVMLDAAGPRYALSLHDAAEPLQHVYLPGRFERAGKYIFDVAHNPDGAAVLARTIRQVAPDPPIAVLLTVLNDKDWRGLMRELSSVADEFVLTNAPTAPSSRAWNPADACDFAVKNGWRAEVIADFDDALEHAAERASTVVITGSFHTVGDAMTRLKVDPLAG
jgi:dihydrofolate synthase/folylpolyglutamate synthase